MIWFGLFSTLGSLLGSFLNKGAVLFWEPDKVPSFRELPRFLRKDLGPRTDPSEGLGLRVGAREPAP